MKILIVVDMQNDFVSMALGTSEAQTIVPAVVKKIEECRAANDVVIFTKDTHYENYMETLEGESSLFLIVLLLQKAGILSLKLKLKLMKKLFPKIHSDMIIG